MVVVCFDINHSKALVPFRLFAATYLEPRGASLFDPPNECAGSIRETGRLGSRSRDRASLVAVCGVFLC